MVKDSGKYQWLKIHTWVFNHWYLHESLIIDIYMSLSSLLFTWVFNHWYLPESLTIAICMSLKDSCKYQWLKTHVNINDERIM
jgi:hypothetical protein